MSYGTVGLGFIIMKMNRCLCLINSLFINSCLLLSTDLLCDKIQRAPYIDSMLGLFGTRHDAVKRCLAFRSVTGSNMTSLSTLLLKVEFVSTVLSPTEHNIHTSVAASTGVSPTPTHPPAGPWFHAGSFIGGMMLALVIILAVSLGYRLACSRQEVRYRAIEEHDAII